jgi:4-nitrophenyl phosphatase
VPAPALICDLDGVVWLGRVPIPGSVDAVARARAAGVRVLFVTNNSSAPVERQEAALGAMGIPAAGDVLTSSMAAALLLRAGERVLVAGGPGIVQAVERAGAVVAGRTDDGSRGLDDAAEPADAVLVGYHETFDYLGLARASAAVRAGARLIGTNRDATYPHEYGLSPGGGSILVAVESASGVVATVAGKPCAPMGDLVRRTLGIEDLSGCWVVGDRDDTDGAFARTIGARFALAASGVTSAVAASAAAAADSRTAAVRDLADCVDRMLAE